MLFDDDQNLRSKAFKIIKDTRKMDQSVGIRKFKKPNLDFGCAVYYEMTCLDGCEPPFTKKFSEPELEALAENPMNFETISQIKLLVMTNSS